MWIVFAIVFVVHVAWLFDDWLVVRQRARMNRMEASFRHVRDNLVAPKETK